MRNKTKLIVENWRNFLKEEGAPTAVAVLGAPAGGKSYTMGQLKQVVDDVTSFKATMESGEELTVDKIRAEIQAMDAKDQMIGFVHAFYYLKEKAQKDSAEFGKWFRDIKNLWDDKLDSLIPDIEITVTDEDLFFNGNSSINSLSLFNDINCEKIIEDLHPYYDYKRITRYFQSKKADDAVTKYMGIRYDESGDEPNKIIKKLDKLHDKDYITDTFLIHAENVATNIIQNFFRVVTGGDGGRDSSSAIIDAYNQIENNKQIYIDNAEEAYEIESNELEQIKEPLKKANIEDDDERDDKPIDVFVRIKGMKPQQAYKVFKGLVEKQKGKEAVPVFNALIKYAYLYFKNMPPEAKSALESITKDMSESKALEILRTAADTGNYIYAHGGITPELVKNAESVMSEAFSAFNKYLKLF